MPTVFANGRSIVHKGDGQVNTAAPPDVCKTPSPGGPIPIPYVNIAKTSDLAAGTKKVLIEGKPAGNAGSNLSTSSGDEAGTAGGGLLSSKTKGKLTWATKSADVILEGKGAVRFMDVAQHNGNSFNTVFTEMGGTGFAYGDDFQGKCPVCKKDPDKHAVPERVEGSLKIADLILKDLQACEKAWKAANDKAQRAINELARDIRNAPNMKPATIEARQQVNRALVKAVDALEGHRRSDSGGYMFGVMVCIRGKKYAALSGGDEMPPEFKKSAEKHGCTVIEGAATLKNFQATSSNPGKVAEQWEAAMVKHGRGDKGYGNEPGTCAGAKIIGKSGCIADSMTEIFFSWGGKKAQTFNVIYRGPAEFAPAGGKWTAPTRAALAGTTTAHIEERRDMQRRVGLTVPSCKSCQDTLFMARCDIEGRSCK